MTGTCHNFVVCFVFTITHGYWNRFHIFQLDEEICTCAGNNQQKTSCSIPEHHSVESRMKYRVTIIFLANAKRTTETAFSVCAVLHSTVNSFSRILRWQSNINTVLSKLNPRKQKLPTHLLTSKGMMLGRLKGKLVNNYLKNKQISTAFFSETGCSSEPV